MQGSFLLFCKNQDHFKRWQTKYAPKDALSSGRRRRGKERQRLQDKEKQTERTYETERHLLRRQELTPRRVRLVTHILDTLKKVNVLINIYIYIYIFPIVSEHIYVVLSSEDFNADEFLNGITERWKDLPTVAPSGNPI